MDRSGCARGRNLRRKDFAVCSRLFVRDSVAPAPPGRKPAEKKDSRQQISKGDGFNVLPNTGLRARYRRCVIARLPAVHADDTIPPRYIGGPPSQTIA